MRDFDEGFGSLPDGPAMEIRHPVFRDDVVYGTAGSDHTGTRIEHRHNAGNLSALGRRRNGDHGLSVPATGSSPDEIHLPANAAVKERTYGIGADLAGDI